MSRLYSVTFENVSISAAQDLLWLAPAAAKACRLQGVVLSNVGGTADAGDAQEELLRVLIVRGLATVGSGGTSVTTPAPLTPNDPAASFTARTNDTTIATGGTAVNLHADGWNIRIPYLWMPTPDLMPLVTSVQTSIVVRLVGAPNDAVSCSGTFYIEEI